MKKVIDLDTSKIKYYLKKGFGHKNWYEEESKRLLEILPEFEGLPILRIFAITSMTTSIEANVHLAIKALLQLSRGEEFKGFLPNQKKYLELIKAGYDVSGRKIMNFIKALEGDRDAVVVDVWMTRAFGVARKRKFKDRMYVYSPTKVEYDAIEDYCRKDANSLGVEARQYQSMIWGGIKKEESVFSNNIAWSKILEKKRGFIPYN